MLNRQIAAEPANCSQTLWSQLVGQFDEGDQSLAYTITAKRENETMESERGSSLIAIAKAKVWASEGWRVVITDEQGREYAPAQFDDLSPSRRAALS